MHRVNKHRLSMHRVACSQARLVLVSDTLAVCTLFRLTLCVPLPVLSLSLSVGRGIKIYTLAKYFVKRAMSTYSHIYIHMCVSISVCV